MFPSFLCIGSLSFQGLLDSSPAFRVWGPEVAKSPCLRYFSWAVWPYFSRFRLFHHLISRSNPCNLSVLLLRLELFFMRPLIFHEIREDGRWYSGIVEANSFDSSTLVKSQPWLHHKWIHVKSALMEREILFQLQIPWTWIKSYYINSLFSECVPTSLCTFWLLYLWSYCKCKYNINSPSPRNLPAKQSNANNVSIIFIYK